MPQAVHSQGFRSQKSFARVDAAHDTGVPVLVPIGNFDAPPQSTRKRLDNVLAAVGQTQLLHGALHALAKLCAAEPVQMPLRAQVLFDREGLIEALRLKHDADAAPDGGGRPARGGRARKTRATTGPWEA